MNNSIIKKYTNEEMVKKLEELLNPYLDVYAAILSDCLIHDNRPTEEEFLAMRNDPK
jgi:hypothetical protein